MTASVITTQAWDSPPRGASHGGGNRLKAAFTLRWFSLRRRSRKRFSSVIQKCGEWYDKLPSWLQAIGAITAAAFAIGALLIAYVFTLVIGELILMHVGGLIGVLAYCFYMGLVCVLLFLSVSHLTEALIS